MGDYRKLGSSLNGGLGYTYAIIRGTIDSDIAPSVFARRSVPLGNIMHAAIQKSAKTLANDVKTSAKITSEK